MYCLEMSKYMLKPGVFKHFICRNRSYPRSNITRGSVPEDFVYWSVSYPNYLPLAYTAPHINGNSWADLEICDNNFMPNWNALDGIINRVSHHGNYQVDAGGFPLNPFGRTGVKGRGLLGRWGPNHAADPIVTRWKRNENGEIVKKQPNKTGILQMVAIQRHDNNMWAIPGGMVDAGEKVTTTLKREFMEEALDSFDKQNMIDEFFSNGVEIYKGYVDDFRNTDNAWMETVAYNFHDETGDKVGSLKLSAGDDAANVKWLDINCSIRLHANHNHFVERTASRLNADW